MIVDGYKAFVNKSDVASVVKEYVAIIAVGISGVGNGPSHNTSFCTLCISPLQGAITPETAVGSYTDAYASTHIMQ